MIKKLLFLTLFSVSFVATAQINLIKDTNTGAGSGGPTNLFVFNNLIYFGSDDSSGTNTGGTDVGRELWVSDGTETGTTYFGIDFRPGTSGGSPRDFVTYNSKLYFSSWDSATSANGFFETDGTIAGTIAQNISFSVLNPKVIGSKMYLVNTTEITSVGTNNSFFEFNGTNFTAVSDTGSGFPQISGGNYTNLGNSLIILYMRYLISDGAGGSIDANLSNYEPFVYNITTQTYTLLADIDPGDNSSSATNFTELNNKVYFEAEDELWETDGTPAGTLKVAVAETAGINGINNFFAWNNKLYFEGDDGSFDQLWSYDPTANTVTNISNISGKDHNPVHFVALGSYIYYAGESAASSTDYIYRTDGTTIEQVTTTVSADDLAVLNNKIYFEGEDAAANLGRELYELDVTTLNVNAFKKPTEIISVYPNPIESSTIRITGNTSENTTFEIFSTTGKMVLKGAFVDHKVTHNLKTGMYLIRINNGSNTTTKKIIIK